MVTAGKGVDEDGRHPVFVTTYRAGHTSADTVVAKADTSSRPTLRTKVFVIHATSNNFKNRFKAPVDFYQLVDEDMLVTEKAMARWHI